MSNGHVYPEVDRSKADLRYAEHKYLYRNLQNGRFEDVTDQGGQGILENAPARGCAFGDYDNDGDVDVVVNCINSVPQLLRCDSTLNRNWIKIKLVGVKSNRSGIGSRVRVTTSPPGSKKPFVQTDEHLTELTTNLMYVIEEGGKILKASSLAPASSPKQR